MARALRRAGVLLGLAGLVVAGFGSEAKAQAKAQPGPRHRGIKADTKCSECHTTASWNRVKPKVKIDFAHQSTGFPLYGAHRRVTCDRCHSGRGLAREGASCQSCHKDVHRGENGARCEKCHNERSFAVTDATRKHRMTRFPLIGAHAVADCNACHLLRNKNRFRGTPTQCYACHAAAYAKSQNPPHAQSGFPTTCQSCHLPRAWLARSNFHNQFFPLRGEHAALACNSCHKNNVFKGTPANCSACHGQQFAATTNPSHSAAGFSQQCQECHTDRGWVPASRFRHTASFSLTGAHRVATCNSCHQNNVFRGTSGACFSCHQQKYAQTTSPNHQAASFPTTCDTCHTTTAWRPSSFDHNRIFRLQGAHASQSCQACHGNGVYRGTSRTCNGCHQAKYNQTTNPNHQAASFPTTCDTCHSQNAWQPSSFDHNRTFRLQGAHAQQTCQACHGNGVYRGTPRNCFGCHQAKYNQTTNPNHQSSGFGTTCQDCHSQNAWRPASFNHDPWFPITSGNHARFGNNCQNCHPQASNKRIFTCIACHEHRQSKMDSEHRGRAGYVYDSNACYRCHPRGRK